MYGHLAVAEKQAEVLVYLSQVTVGTPDVDALEGFHRDVLQLRVERVTATAIEVTVGSGVVRYEARAQAEGAHHLAFAIAPEDFERAHEFLAARVDLIAAGGDTVIDGPGSWSSRSAYFNAPDGLILEYIAHEERRGLGRQSTAPTPHGIAEVGIGVPDVPAAVQALSSRGLTPYPPQGAAFAPVGDIDGLLILVDQHRLWFPEMRTHATTDPSTISISAPGAATDTVKLERATLNID